MQFARPKVQNWPHQPPKITSQASNPPSGMSDGFGLFGDWVVGALAFSRSVVLVTGLGEVVVVLLGWAVMVEGFMVLSLVVMGDDCEEWLLGLG